MYRVMAVDSCWVHGRTAGNTCAMYQSLDNRNPGTYRILCAIYWSLVYACLACNRTFVVSLAQMSLIVCAMVPQNVIPSIVACVWYSIPRAVSLVHHPPTAMAFDFLGLRRVPEARSNSQMVSSIIGKSAIELTKMVTSSAYAITDV